MATYSTCSSMSPPAANATRDNGVSPGTAALEPQSDQRNQLFRGASRKLYARLKPTLERLSLSVGTLLHDAGAPITYVYFPSHGVCSLIVALNDGAAVEAFTVGNEGFVGLPVLFGARTDALRAVCQVADPQACRMSAPSFRRLAGESTEFRGAALGYAQAALAQVAWGSACNRRHSITERCARWLLLTHDRVETDEFGLTQEFLATMLGVRRAGVSVAASVLQDAGLIRYTRGRITIVNRAGLQRAACECYEATRRASNQART
ncbi:MAG: Crp/Fnr family transcriptional regulator [Gemmatimonadaceae bacterium]